MSGIVNFNENLKEFAKCKNMEGIVGITGRIAINMTRVGLD